MRDHDGVHMPCRCRSSSQTARRTFTAGPGSGPLLCVLAQVPFCERWLGQLKHVLCTDVPTASTHSADQFELRLVDMQIAGVDDPLGRVQSKVFTDDQGAPGTSEGQVEHAPAFELYWGASNSRRRYLL